MPCSSSRTPKSEKIRTACENEDSSCLLEQIEIEIDGKKLTVNKSTTILEAAKKAGIKIPTLCHHSDLCLAGICRICLVEVKGMKTLQAACSFSISAPISIVTHSAEIRKSRKDVLDLMLSSHKGECYSCIRNNNCELQMLAAEYGVTSYPFGKECSPDTPVDSSSFSIVRDMNKCILCRRCVRSCIDLQEVGVYSVLNRGAQSKVSTFAELPMGSSLCINCGQCINRCPTGALHEKEDIDPVWKSIDNPSKFVVIQTAPAPRAGICEEFGMSAGTPLTLEMNTALRQIGFDAVFDTCFSADLTIMEEGTELLKRLKNGSTFPMFTSCSPGWVKYLEHFFPEFIPNLSTAKSPQQMFGAMIKTYYSKIKNIPAENIVTVALMPCTAKKFEANRPEMNSSGYQDVDFGLTTRELAKMIKKSGIELPKMEKSGFDSPFGENSGSGVIFGATGGVMESAVRTVYELVTGEEISSLFEKGNITELRGFEGIKYIELPIHKTGEVPAILKPHFENFDFLKGAVIKAAVCHGTANAKKVLEDIKNGGKFSECHFIEFMACPGGCLGGGGQPIPTSAEIRKKRAEAIYSEDDNSAIRKSYQNPAVIELYTNFLKYPDSDISKKYLHTKYIVRGNRIV
jgi:[NiFe] hydrogenase diaphorase moiety small subunit